MRVLITGASGYLGARFVRFLKKSHPDMTLFLASRSGACHWLYGLGEQIPLDFRFDREWTLPSGLDAVVHLAALNEIDCVNVDKALQVNVEGTWRLIEECSLRGAKNFVYASTVHVYGQLVGNFSEDSVPKPHHPYGFTHQMAEQLCEYASTKYNLQVTCLRFSNIVGAPVDSRVNRWTLLVNDLCRQAVISGALSLKSPKSQRDFIGMTDACRAIERALLCVSGSNEFEIFNIAKAENISVRHMAELIATRATLLLGQDISISEDLAATNNPISDFRIDNSKAKLWGWMPTAHLVDEIDDTLRVCMGDNGV